ncbi:DUF1092 family protein [Synechococcus sp. RSCCF101]|uniref:Tab2 family RNA-binding protein n=1 Tax=Synechococcus sp. RSCCF101 TaxID=2511069 RepID=UPI0012475663|nr:Tab2 family RNA-binding protein [Synechococcus sp. RSCCF101]QEY31363.1 DUF1092 family protein [Synechococcus sp. RSCCF101]
MSPDATPSAALVSPDWELDFYSRPVQDSEGRKRWELLICSTPSSDQQSGFRHVKPCPADSVNSIWLEAALAEALTAAEAAGFGRPRRIRSWRGSMRTMVQRSAQALGLELVPSRRCFALSDWLRQREEEVYPGEEGYLAGPLAPPPEPVRPAPLPLPEAARGQRWQWVRLPLELLRDAADWEVDFPALLPVPSGLESGLSVPGIQILDPGRALAIAGWLSGLEPLRLVIDDDQLVLEAGLEDRWRLSGLSPEEAGAARAALEQSRAEVAGLQFIAVQSRADSERMAGFWMLQDRPDL